ncbi:MAG: class I SAM-dependent methyltransferase [Chthoniobacterales bacterium]
MSGLSEVELETMRSVEDELWWYRALRRHVLQLLAPCSPQFDLLDAGCGSGGMLAQIRARFPKAALTGLDYSERALELTAERQLDVALTAGSTDRIPLPDNSFEVVLSLDVIVARGVDVPEALREMQRVLRPGGRLMLNVPAFDFLRGSHDVAVGNALRYTRRQLAQLLGQTGYTISHMTYWNMSLMPAVAAARWRSRGRAAQQAVRSDLAPLWPPLNAVLTALASGELALSRAIPLPFGTSLFAVAQK